MNLMTSATQLARSPGDPRVIQAGSNVQPTADRVARGLGWFSIALGAAELAAPSALARMLGMEGRETLIRAYGVREIAAGMTSLSTEKTAGLWSRVGGDVLDIATLLAAYRDDNPKRHNVGLAMAAVVGITLLDLVTATASTKTHGRGSEEPRDFSDRSGFPQGLERARQAAVS